MPMARMGRHGTLQVNRSTVRREMVARMGMPLQSFIAGKRPAIALSDDGADRGKWS